MNAFLAGMALCAATAQDPPPPLAVLPGGIEVTVDDYKDYLFEITGSSRLEELIMDRILAVEVAGVDRTRIAADVAQGLQAPQARVQRVLAERVRDDFGGDARAFATYLERVGRSADEERAATRVQVLRELRVNAIVQSRRKPDEKRLRWLFDHHYGVDGRRVRVRHLFLSADRARRELAAASSPEAVTEQAVDRRLRARAAALQRELADGTAFAALVERESDDPAARELARSPATRADAGWLRGYNFQAFGVAFAEAVRGLQPGQVSDPVRSPSGCHLIALDELEVTRFEDVQDELRALLRDEPATRGERRVLRDQLFAKYEVREARRR